MNHLQFLTRKNLLDATAIRLGETKLGEAITVISDLKQLESSALRFVIVGIMEDIGVRANYGTAGCASTFTEVVAPLCNVQVNRFLDPEKLAIGPVLDFADWMLEAEGLNPNEPNDLQKLRSLTAAIDEEVSALIAFISKLNLVPIVIGGGHNNAFGIIKGFSETKGAGIDVLNIDPHTDFRSLEGRHSGNGFSYAKELGHLNRYAVFGMHESYNNQSILEKFRSSSDLYYLTFDELLGYSTDERDRMFKDALRWLGPGPIGLELDMDSITGFPVSALNASGLTMRQARMLVKTAASLAQPLYFHMAEGAPCLALTKVDRELSAKAMVYFVTDFIKSWGGLQ